VRRSSDGKRSWSIGNLGSSDGGPLDPMARFHLRHKLEFCGAASSVVVVDSREKPSAS
jgi:hypothetical protein